MSEFKPQNIRYAKLVDRYSRFIESPVQRLKFLNSALKAEPPSGLMMRIPLLGSLPERMKLIVELSRVLPITQRAPLAFRLTSLLYKIRYALYALCAVFAISAFLGLIYTGSRLVSSLASRTEAQIIPPAESSPLVGPDGVKAVEAIGTEAGITLEKVWLAESGEGYEFYSNGARVLTEFETIGPERNFYRFSLQALNKGSDEAETLSKPVGILYHVSESDLLPFADHYNASLKTRSRALLEYVRENRLYNYLIDRFGRTYRIVGDEYTANHAGNSVWSDGESVYVNLSPSFIGVCFEGQSKAGEALGADGINEAQIYAARVLTAVLRSRYAIEDTNCVTHGLVSVNPSNNLMGYHTDWVSNFPFEALGLKDKYKSELIAISHLGFAYDQAYIQAAGGKKWEGLDQADARLEAAAKGEGKTVEQERRAQQQIYQLVYNKERGLESK